MINNVIYVCVCIPLRLTNHLLMQKSRDVAPVVSVEFFSGGQASQDSLDFRS